MNLLEIAAIRDRLREELAVVERFMEIAKKHGVNGRNGSEQVKASSSLNSFNVDPDKQRNLKLEGEKKEYGLIGGAVREAIALASEEFTIRNVAEILQKLDKPFSKLQIATVLARLAEKNEILIKKRGKGSKPTIYKKKEATTQNQRDGRPVQQT